MLETVQADDTATLDEIDARYWCAGQGVDFLYALTEGSADVKFGIKGVAYYKRDVPIYTRSRDLLKLERPDGCFVIVAPRIAKPVFIGSAYFPVVGVAVLNMRSPDLPTEELAEFYAIIQAKIWILENE